MFYVITVVVTVCVGSSSLLISNCHYCMGNFENTCLRGIFSVDCTT